MVKKIVAIIALIAIASLSIAGCTSSSNSNISPLPPGSLTRDPVIAGMIGAINETNIYSTTNALQRIPTRLYGTAGNVEAAGLLYSKLSAIPGLKVAYEDGSFKNIIATLPGTDNSASGIVMVGAHYDSISNTASAPGATDDAGGVAIVVELARVMSQHQFNHTIAFALWNSEEKSPYGSDAYTNYAATHSMQISLYFNYDSSCYDPNNSFILDIMSNTQSSWVKDEMIQDNIVYGIGFTLTNNVHNCGSDHQAFWNHGYTAVMTHEEPTLYDSTNHDSAHTSSDTINHVSTAYALKNGQLGMAVLAQTAGVRGFAHNTQHIQTVDSTLAVGYWNSLAFTSTGWPAISYGALPRVGLLRA